MYEASVKIIIKDDENTTSGLSETSAFEDLKIMQFNNSIENEKSVITSRTIMGHVVDSLEIDVILKSIGGVTGLTKRDLYGVSPIEIDILDTLQTRENIAFKFIIKLLNEQKAQIVNVNGEVIKGIEYGKSYFFKACNCNQLLKKRIILIKNLLAIRFR